MAQTRIVGAAASVPDQKDSGLAPETSHAGPSAAVSRRQRRRLLCSRRPPVVLPPHLSAAAIRRRECNVGGRGRHVRGMTPILGRNHQPGARGARIPEAVIERLVRAAAWPSDELVAGIDLEGPLELLGERIVARQPRPLPSRRRRPRAFVLVFAALALSITSGAIAGVFTTHTGIHPKSGTENDRSELLRTGTPDFPPLVRRTIADIPFPPGSANLSARTASYVRFIGQLGPDNTVQAAGIRSTVLLWAVCAWRADWLEATRAGREHAASLAAIRLGEVANSIRPWDVFWTAYLSVATHEAAGDPSVPADFKRFYSVNCPALTHWWAAR